MNQLKQEPCELAEIIHEKPLSGGFAEVLFGSDKGNTLWVKFSDKDGANEWVGKFGVGGSGVGRVAKIAEPDIFLVSAGGCAYLVDASKRELVNQYCDTAAQDVVCDNQRKLLIVARWTQLRWVEFGGKILFSRDIAWDGIRDLEIDGRVLSGLACLNYGGKEERFRFDLDKLEILDFPPA
jgi:hypothetical protein